MTKQEYRVQLESPMWQELRKKILIRDKFQCRKCKAKACMLHVHHKYYTEGAKAWQYPLKALVTLCAPCHKAEHFGKGVEIRPRKIRASEYLTCIQPSLPKKSRKVSYRKRVKASGKKKTSRKVVYKYK